MRCWLFVPMFAAFVCLFVTWLKSEAARAVYADHSVQPSPNAFALGSVTVLIYLDTHLAPALSKWRHCVVRCKNSLGGRATPERWLLKTFGTIGWVVTDAGFLRFALSLHCILSGAYVLCIILSYSSSSFFHLAATARRPHHTLGPRHNSNYSSFVNISSLLHLLRHPARKRSV